MSIQAVGWALEQDLPARPKLVLCAIANHADHTNGYCYLKAETIAREGACKPRSVYNFVGALIRNGYIRKTLRKGDDGKQRATDYWILFDREEKPWAQDASLEADEGDSEPSESDTADDQPQDVVVPHAPGATGKNDLPDARHDTRQPVEKPNLASGPVATACHRKSSEPSKTNPKESSAGARAFAAAPPRSYRPPPPQPVAEVFDNGKQIFVFDGTPAYEAWAKVKAQQGGVRNWHLTTRKLVDDRWRSGWYFPTLFPKEGKTGPPTKQEPEISDQDANELSKTATGA